MTVGLAAFGYTILNSTHTNLSGGYYLAFGYADVCSFIMAVFFCVQGLFIMLGSVRQSRVWYFAAEMSSRDLQKQIAIMEKWKPIFWKCVYLPFCDVREQAEFRIIQSIFSSTYNISTRSQEFDFGMFLRMSHEANILSIIEIRPEKWVIIILVTLLPALKIELYESTCTSTRCEVQEEIFILITLGFVNTVLSLILLVCGRISELRLLRKAGVQSVADYGVFLKVEEKTRHLIAKKSVHSSAVKAAITEYITEAENMKENKRLARRITARRSSMAARMKTMALLNTRKISPMSPNPPTQGNTFNFGSRSTKSSSEFTDRVVSEMSPKSVDVVEENSVRPYPSPRLSIYSNPVDTITTGDSTSNSSAPTALHKQRTPPKDGYIQHTTSTVGDGFVIAPLFSESSEEEDDFFDECPLDRDLATDGRDLENQTQPRTSITQSSIPHSPDAADGDNSLNKRPQERRRSSLLNITADMFSRLNAAAISSGSDASKPQSRRNSVVKPPNFLRAISGKGHGDTSRPRRMSRNRQSFMSRMSGLTRMREGKSDFKELLKKNSGKLIFNDIFLFGMPQLYFGLMSLVITCNSLYLAWWTTNFLMFILKLKDISDTSMLIALSALPPLLTFPFLYLAVKASSILKALSRLDLDIVSAVVEKTESNAATKRFFRELCMNLVKDSVNPKMALNDLFEEYSVDGITLHWDEFQSLVINSKIHLTQQKLRYLYDSMLPSKSKCITAKDFERFVFGEPVDNITEQNNEQQSDTIVVIDSDSMKESASRILDFLDPNVQLGISIVVDEAARIEEVCA
eukprot:CAMPEP_0185026600 /NCGR_PEP_ID=MMETSP1103-20130426/10950_1 /TAXON_ID=36769 /ORGANISM="Paraphysomonas bandaiensis, Strain Caron Lab Isolate" /LENGTH=801 /DNA_ID=CAMNT_0027560235 /DNA_START=330 /DNA_END=2735 /DNA_ORIENTATION=+